MKLRVPKSILDKAIRSVSKAVPGKGVQPILSNILFENNNGHLSLNATDLDLSIEAIIPSSNIESGSITLSARKLEEIVSKLDDDDVEISVDLVTNKATVHCRKANFDLVGIPADEFPRPNRPESKTYFSLSKSLFVRIIDMVQFAASRYDTNNILGGVYIAVKDSETSPNIKIMEFAGTDGNRLSSYEIPVEFSDNLSSLTKKEVIVPIKVMMDINRIIESSVDDTIKISFTSNQIVFKTEDRLVVSRLLDGVYPRYKQLIPSSASLDKIAQVDRKQMLSCLERVAVMANEITNLVHLNFSGQTLTIKSSNLDYGGAEDTIAIEYMGDDIDIYFNVRYLIEALKCMDSDRVQISMVAKLNPVVIKPISDEQFTHLVMPIKHK
jgi:DNA polymerase-3 subunit beta